MGNDAVLLWLSEELAVAYWLALVVAMAGLLQVVAVRTSREELRWLPQYTALPVGLCMIFGAAVWFYTFYYPLILVPGPAGFELMVLFGAATATAAWLSRFLSWLRRRAR